ncbi:hypothetical protein SLA2020_394490 [Shorea laevis]
MCRPGVKPVSACTTLGELQDDVTCTLPNLLHLKVKRFEDVGSRSWALSQLGPMKGDGIESQALTVLGLPIVEWLRTRTSKLLRLVLSDHCC